MLISVWSMCQFWISLHRKVKFFLSEFWSKSIILKMQKLNMLLWFWFLHNKLIKWGASRLILSIVYIWFKITKTCSIFDFSNITFLSNFLKIVKNQSKKASFHDGSWFKIDTCSKLKSAKIWASKREMRQYLWDTL